MRTGLMALSGHNQRALIALCRWAAATEVPLHLVRGGPNDPIQYTDYGSQVFMARSTAALELGQITAWIRRLQDQQGYDRVVLAPSTEYFNRFLLRHRVALEAAGGVVPLVEEALYTQVSDKQSFSALCAAHGIAVPATQPTPPRPPFVAKPKRYLSSSGLQIKPCLIRSEAERADFLRTEAVGDYFFQEFVTGASLYLLAHRSRGGQLVTSAQENLIQQAGGGSIVLARAHDFHREADARPYLDLLRRIDFHGLIMIEVRRCARTGRAVMIEANPRLWGPQQFMLDRGVDPFTPLLRDHGVTVPRMFTNTADGQYYFWSGGLCESGAGCDFHNYSPAQFEAEQARIVAADLYARDDTLRLHHAELEPA